jgi:hypothetical protein
MHSTLGRDTQYMDETLGGANKTQSLINEDRVISPNFLVDFALTQKTINITEKVGEQLESLHSFLDLLRMRLAIQEDFTLSSIVTLFDSSKKGFITVDDLKRADVLQSLDHL